MSSETASSFSPSVKPSLAASFGMDGSVSSSLSSSSSLTSDDVNASYRESFQKLIDHLQKAADDQIVIIGKLEELLDIMKQHTSAFDQEDFDLITQKIDSRKQALEHISDELHRRHNTYSTQIVAMEDALEQRERIFNSVPAEVIEQNQDLFDALAKKQQTLNQFLTEMRSKLAEPIPILDQLQQHPQT